MHSQAPSAAISCTKNAFQSVPSDEDKTDIHMKRIISKPTSLDRVKHGHMLKTQFRVKILTTHLQELTDTQHKKLECIEELICNLQS